METIDVNLNASSPSMSVINDKKFVGAQPPKNALETLKILCNPLKCPIIKILATMFPAHDYSD